jgi:hypothetical protein
VHDAVLGGLTRLAELAHHRRADRAAMIDFELSHMHWHGNEAGVDLPDSWIAEDVLIDGVACPARSRRLEKAWATIFDFSTVAVAVVGPAAMSHLGHELSDRSARLNQHV